MKMPLVFKIVDGRCRDPGEHPIRMSVMKSSCNMSDTFVGLQRIPVFRSGVHVGEYTFEFARLHAVVDCGLSVDFRFALPIIDSALRNGVAITDILNVCSTMRRDCTPIFRLLHYANPARSLLSKGCCCITSS